MDKIKYIVINSQLLSQLYKRGNFMQSLMPH
jgi:hypothetical protein